MEMVDVTKLGGWLRSFLSESDGTGSNTRFCIAAVVFFSLGWVTALIVKVRGPVSVAEISAVLGPLGMFVGTICAPLYAMNKWADVQNNRSAKPPEQ